MVQRLKNALSSLLFALVLTDLQSAGSIAHAQESYKKLTQDNIRQFIIKTTEITSGMDYNLSTDDIIAYLELHIHKKAHFKTIMKYKIPGQPDQETALKLKKKTFIESVKQGSEALTDYESKIEVKKINISRDGKKATVQTQSHESGYMPISADGIDTELIPVEGFSNCNQIIMLSKKGIIQMYSANCTTTMSFLEY